MRKKIVFEDGGENKGVGYENCLIFYLNVTSKDEK